MTCLYGVKVDEIFRNVNRREKAKGNASVTFELVMEMDDGSELLVKRSWTPGAASDPRPKDLTERLVHENAVVLADLGLVERTDQGSVLCSFTDIHVDMHLGKAS